jgi:hypothetical protein
MGFGFQQARAAGAPYDAPGTASSYNWGVRERQAEKEIRQILKDYPQATPRIAKLIKNRPTVNLAGMEINVYSKQLLLWMIQDELNLPRTYRNAA